METYGIEKLGIRNMGRMMYEADYACDRAGYRGDLPAIPFTARNGMLCVG